MSASANSLRPAWNKGGGKGFQPPPTVASERAKKEEPRNFNAFAALDDDDEGVAAAAVAASDNKGNNSRSEALRGSGGGAAAAAAAASKAAAKASGRSLAELEARLTPAASTGTAEKGRFERVRSDSNVSEKSELKVIRITRERLLSLRPPALPDVPEVLKEFMGSVIVAESGQDPVCWDSFDADEIWATQPRRQSSVKAPPGVALEEGGLGPRRVSAGRREGGGGRWERGVALPPPDQAKKREKDANNADELWDDPTTGGAASDFSAFGAGLPREAEPFDFDKMAEASRELEKELHGERSRTDSDASGALESLESEDAHVVKIDPARPLASAGTTIRSGSGDGVNVFEDFDDPSNNLEEEVDAAPSTIKAGAEDPSASSRLMDMIGVKREELPGLNLGGAPEGKKGASPWGATTQPTIADAPSLSLNPWGTTLMPPAQKGLDMQVLSELEEQKRRSEELRRRQEEEAQRRLALQQADERARQAAVSQQQAGVQSQVEIVLLERITSILENSWGRSDLMSILTTLHSEDSRVIPLLTTVDALRALILRNPRRISVRHDPAFGSEMAILAMTNAQWQQFQQQEAQARQQEEDERRRREELEMQHQRNAAINAMPPIMADAPWYYSDPQRNIQGPFRAQEMRQWLEAGYFKGDLPISQQPTGPFRPLQLIFPNLGAAFTVPDNSATDTAREQAEAEERAREQRARAEQEAAERERFAREEANRAREEANRATEEARMKDTAAAKEHASSTNGTDSSSQLKMMLGLSAGMAGSEPSPESVSAPPVLNDKKTKAGKINNSQQRKNQQGQAPNKSSSAPAVPAAPAPVWGSTPQQKASAKTLAEIQKEEARKNALLAMQQQKTGASSSGWANVAAARGGSTAWQSGTVKPTTGAVLTNPNTNTMTGQTTARERATSGGKGGSSSSQGQSAQQDNSTSSAAEEFGAKMSPSLEKWCKDQMMKLNGTDDLTLVSFCMTLNNASEIRQYLTAYLGTSPQVNNFATDFINKRGLGGPAQQEEWETTAQVKKSKKKKGAR